MDPIDLDLASGRRLRSLRADDVAALYAAGQANTEHLRRWMPWANDPGPERTEGYVRAAVALFETGEALPGLIVEDAAIVGACGFNRIERQNDSATVGYWLAASHVGCGLMTAAVRALIAYGFGDLELHRIEIGTAPDNARSRAIPERLGFTEEGVRREAERHPDRYGDLVIYSLLRHEWRNS